ncbi:MAG: alkaline phosphatase PhoX [Actinomycetota bacterium]
MRRRELMGAGVGAAASLAFGAAFWKGAFDGGESGASDGSRPRGASYGPRGAPNADGLRLPEGFTARRVARGEEVVGGTGYRWHLASDGAATFPTDDGGWILVSNSEHQPGGAGAMRFTRGGEIADAYRILDGTTQNCAGGPTPWGTWLSCEEYEEGRVWECDPSGRAKARVHDAMGVFKHEAAAVDPRGRRVYLTEDWEDGAFYRFTPRRWADLSEGLLELAKVGKDGAVQWVRVPDPSARREVTRRQVPGATEFKRAEGIWFDSGTVYVSTTFDSRIQAYHTRRERIEVIYDAFASRQAPLVRVDSITASRGGELFVCEDIATDEINLGVMTRDRKVSKFLSVTGRNHVDSELTGLAFDPSGSRLYFSSQRAHGIKGEVYEVSGPFRGRA